MERFQPIVGAGEGEHGAGGPIRFSRSNVNATSDGDTPILAAGEQAGASLPFGCRMGICHTCVGRLCSGRVRDLRTGTVHGSEGEMVRTCVNAPEGAVEIAL
jgi:ferredoxin